jgi:hypothetical protein
LALPAALPTAIKKPSPDQVYQPEAHQVSFTRFSYFEFEPLYQDYL